MNRTPAILLVTLLALGLASSARAQITSTASGGEWSETGTWIGGSVPTEQDDVIIAPGATVTVSSELKCRDLTLETDASLLGTAFYTVVGGDLVNKGTLAGFLHFVVLGSVHNTGTLGGEEDFSLWMYAYGSIENDGFWGGTLDMAGDRLRTVDARGVTARISVGRSIFYVDPVPPRVLLGGDNYFPSFVLPVRGGDRVVVAPGGRFEIDPAGLEASMDAEHGYWLLNYGRVALMHRMHEGAEGAEVVTHGAKFRTAGTWSADSVRATSYGHQSPETFPNALRRWWRVETWAATAGGHFDMVRFEFAETEVSEITTDNLALYHSGDEGETWTRLEPESIVVSEFPTVRNETYVEMIANGEFPPSGLFAVAADPPSAQRASVSAQIIGRDEIRLGGPAAEYLILYANTGTTPLYRGLLRIDTEGGAYIDRIVTSNPTPLPRDPIVIEADSASLYEDSTSAILMTPSLAPGESRTLSVYLKAIPTDDDDGTAGKASLAAPAVALAIVKGLAAGYLVDLAAHALEETLANPCAPITGSDGSLRKAFDRTDAKWNPFGDSESPWLSAANNGASALAEDGLLKQGLGKANALNDLKTLADGATNGFDRYESQYGSIFKPMDCDGEDPPPRGPEGTRNRKELRPVNSWDPNAKVGPSGAGERGFITSAGTFTYQIQFENLAEATAPAYRIVIVDTLADVFVAESVQRVRESHPGFQFTRDGNVLRWEVEGIELPPNVNPPEGEGFVEFTVDVRSDLASGAEIANRAEIIFDMNPPILTNTHINTLDMLPPVTEMMPLPPTTSGDSLDVAWAADDGEDGSGVASTMLFMSTDGGTFWPLGLTTRSFMRVPVTTGRTYTFYAMARDAAGNAETHPPSAVSTAVVVASEAEAPRRFALGAAYPNPFNPKTNVSFELGAPGRVAIRIYDVIGRRLAQLDLGEMAPGSYRQSIDFAAFASGVYFYELRVRGASGLLFRAIDKAVLIK